MIIIDDLCWKKNYFRSDLSIIMVSHMVIMWFNEIDLLTINVEHVVAGYFSLSFLDNTWIWVNFWMWLEYVCRHSVPPAKINTSSGLDWHRIEAKSVSHFFTYSTVSWCVCLSNPYLSHGFDSSLFADYQLKNCLQASFAALICTDLSLSN